MLITSYGRFADAGAAPTAGVSSAAHSTADEGSTLFAEEVPTANTAAAVDGTPADLAGSPQPAKTKKIKRNKSGIDSDIWQDCLMLAQHLSRLQMYHCPHIAYQTLCAMPISQIHVVCTLLIGPSVAKTTGSFGLPGEVHSANGTHILELS